MTDSPFDLASGGAGWVWMNHLGGVAARFPAAAAPMWEALGWAPCDPPAEVDPTRAEMPPAPAPAQSRKPKGVTDARLVG